MRASFICAGVLFVTMFPMAESVASADPAEHQAEPNVIKTDGPFVLLYDVHAKQVLFANTAPDGSIASSKPYNAGDIIKVTEAFPDDGIDLVIHGAPVPKDISMAYVRVDNETRRTLNCAGPLQAEKGHFEIRRAPGGMGHMDLRTDENKIYSEVNLEQVTKNGKDIQVFPDLRFAIAPNPGGEGALVGVRSYDYKKMYSVFDGNRPEENRVKLQITVEKNKTELVEALNEAKLAIAKKSASAVVDDILSRAGASALFKNGMRSQDMDAQLAVVKRHLALPGPAITAKVEAMSKIDPSVELDPSKVKGYTPAVVAPLFFLYNAEMKDNGKTVSLRDALVTLQQHFRFAASLGDKDERQLTGKVADDCDNILRHPGENHKLKEQMGALEDDLKELAKINTNREKEIKGEVPFTNNTKGVQVHQFNMFEPIRIIRKAYNIGGPKAAGSP